MARASLQVMPVSTADTQAVVGLDKSLRSLDLSSPPTTLEESGADYVLSPVSTSLGSVDEGSEWSLMSPSESKSSSRSSTWKTALEDARHFAGGLISHPYEASRHFSVLRHSHGLVYFKGFNTNIAITVFGDQALPTDRQFWLQKRGFSGKTGLKIGASMFGTKGAWINVTPTTRCDPEHLPPSDERAWQRDIAKFLKKAGREVRKHAPLETCVLRVPCSADDGYFRVVLCSGDRGKKTLCPSPVFRVISTSMSMGSIRGASLSTMPLEVGIKVGQFAARQAASNAAAPLAGTAVQQVQSLLPWQPSGLVEQMAVSQAQDAATGKVSDAHAEAEEAQERQVDQLVAEFQDQAEHAKAIGKESGPEQPYPICFSAKVVEGIGKSREEIGLPTANLAKISNSLALRLSGTFFGWAKFASVKDTDMPDYLLNDWHQVVLSAFPQSESQKASIVMEKDFSAYLIADFHEWNFIGANLDFVLMGTIRPRASRFHLGEQRDVSAHIKTLFRDIAATEASLSRPAWQPEETLERVKSDKRSRSFNERYASARGTVQEQVDKVPVHKAGVRTNSMALRDRLVGNGGVWVPR